jgi:RimJ/RimL family protein N-acetyltransferase
VPDPAIHLVLFDDSHLPGMEAMVNDPDVLRFTRVPNPPPPGFPRTWFDTYEAGRALGTHEAFAILGADDDFLGVAVAPRIDREGLTLELGYVIAPHARGRGVATEALKLLTAWAFDELGARRLELLISVDNGASKRVATKVGYVYEGTMRQMHFKQDLWEDGEIWSRLPTDA